MSKYETVRVLTGKSIPIMMFIVSILLALLLGEFILRFVATPRDFLHASVVDDPALGHRIGPHTSGHDALGFRNSVVPGKARIVAIGDSQTYGLSAPSDGSWPHQLGELLHEPVYNMALGGYGPLQYLYLAAHEAKSLQPQHLVVGLYIGNDLADAYRLAHHSPYWSAWREGDTVKNTGAEEQQTASEGRKNPASIRGWLSRHSVLYSMLKITLFSRLASAEQARKPLQVSTNQEMIWSDPTSPSISTIFTPQWRFDAMDTRQAMIKEGLSLTKKAFTSMQKEANAQETKLLIVLIPTKERVYCRYLKSSNEQMPNTFISLCDAEDRIKNDLILFFSANKIAYVDVTEAMEEQTYQHTQIYPKTADGHPLAVGYGVIARKIYDAVR